MIAWKRCGIGLALFFVACPSSRAADEKMVMSQAIKLLEEIASDPKSGFPSEALREAKGITIWPHFVETLLGLGRDKGRGVYLRRNEQGEWVDPEILEISALSLGPQVGRKVTDRVFIYRTEKAMEKDIKREYFFGMTFEVSSTLGHTHKFYGPKPEKWSDREILEFRRPRGVLVGARMMGEVKSGTLSANAKADSSDDDPKKKKVDGDVLTTSATKASTVIHPTTTEPPEAGRLRALLASMTPPPKPPVAVEVKNDSKVNKASNSKPVTQAIEAPR